MVPSNTSIDQGGSIPAQKHPTHKARGINNIPGVFLFQLIRLMYYFPVTTCLSQV